MKLSNKFGSEIELDYVSLSNIPLSWNVPLARINNGPGGVITARNQLETRTIQLSGPIYDRDKSNIHSTLQTLLILLQSPPIQVYSDNFARDDMFFNGYPENLPQNWIDKRELRINLNMVVPEPFLYGEKVEEVDPSELENEGNYPVSPLIQVTFSDSGGLIQIENTTNDDIIEIEHDFENGDVLVIDNRNFVIKLNGDNILDDVNDDWLLNGYKLERGSNNVTYTGPPATVEYEYRPKWI